MSVARQQSEARGLPHLTPQEAALPWRWRGHEHGAVTYYLPTEMETRHLFYTLRMIWNNFMPAHMRVGRVKLYTFGPHYTREYLRQAVKRVSDELFTRRDITPAWQCELDEMFRWMETRPAELEAPILALPHLERA